MEELENLVFDMYQAGKTDEEVSQFVAEYKAKKEGNQDGSTSNVDAAVEPNTNMASASEGTSSVVLNPNFKHITAAELNDHDFHTVEGDIAPKLEKLYGEDFYIDTDYDGFLFGVDMQDKVRIRNKKNGKTKEFQLNQYVSRNDGMALLEKDIKEFTESSASADENDKSEDYKRRKNIYNTTGSLSVDDSINYIDLTYTDSDKISNTAFISRQKFNQRDGKFSKLTPFDNLFSGQYNPDRTEASVDKIEEIMSDVSRHMQYELKQLPTSAFGKDFTIIEDQRERLLKKVFDNINKTGDYLLPWDQFEKLTGGTSQSFLNNEIKKVITKPVNNQHLKKTNDETLDPVVKEKILDKWYKELPPQWKDKADLVEERTPLETSRKEIEFKLQNETDPLEAMKLRNSLFDIDAQIDDINSRIKNLPEKHDDLWSWEKEDLVSMWAAKGMSEPRARLIAEAFDQARNGGAEGNMERIKRENPMLTDREAMLKYLDELMLNEQTILKEGSQTMVNIDLSKLGTDKKKIDQNFINKIKQSGNYAETLDGEIGEIEISIADLMSLGFDARDFKGWFDEWQASGAINMEDLQLLESYEEARDYNAGSMRAVYELTHLDRNPKSIASGTGSVEGALLNTLSAISTFSESGGKTILKEWFDMSEREAGKSIAEGRTEGPSREYTNRALLDNMNMTAADFNEENREAIEKGDMSALVWSEEQLKSIERTFADGVAEGVGQFVPTLIELAAITLASDGMLTATGGAAYLARLKKATDVWSKMKLHTSMLALEELKMQVAGFKAGSGASFYIGGALTPWFRPGALPMGVGTTLKGLDPLWNKTFKAGIVGAGSGEFAQITELGWETLMGEADWSTEMNNLFGDWDEVEKRMMTNAFVFGIAHQMGKGRIKTGLRSRYEIGDFHVTAGAKFRVKKRINDKLEKLRYTKGDRNEVGKLEKQLEKLEKDFKSKKIEKNEYDLTKELINLNIKSYRKRDYSELSKKEKETFDAYERSFIDLQHLANAQAFSRKLDPKNKNFEANYQKIVIDPINTLFGRANKNFKPLTVQFVNSTQAKTLFEDVSNVAEYDKKNNSIMFNKEKFSIGTSNHELVHMALRQVFNSYGERMQIRFEKRIDNIFEQAYGKKLNDWLAENVEKFYTKEKGVQVGREEFLTNLTEVITNPDIYYTQVNTNFIKNASQEIKSFLEEINPALGKYFKPKTAKGFVEFLGRLGDSGRTGRKTAGKLLNLSKLEDISFLGIEYREAVGKSEGKMASRDLAREKEVLKNENISLGKNKPKETGKVFPKTIKVGGKEKPHPKAGQKMTWRDVMTENVKEIKDINKLIERNELTKELIDKYGPLNEKVKEGNAPESTRLRHSMIFEKLRENNMYILDQYILDPIYGYKDVKGSNLTFESFSKYVKNTEFQKLVETYLKRDVKFKDVPFGAYLRDNIKFRTGNILKALKVNLDQQLKFVSRDAPGYSEKEIGYDGGMNFGGGRTEIKTENNLLDIIANLPLQQNHITTIENKIINQEGVFKNFQYDVTRKKDGQYITETLNLDYFGLEDLAPSLTKKMFGKSTQDKANFIANEWKYLLSLNAKNLTETTGTKTGVPNVLMTRKVPKGTEGAYETTNAKGEKVYMKDVFYEKTGIDVAFKDTGARTGTELQKVKDLNKKQYLQEYGIVDNRTKEVIERAREIHNKKSAGEKITAEEKTFMKENGNVDISNMKLDRNIIASLIPATEGVTGRAVTNRITENFLRKHPQYIEHIARKESLETIINEFTSGKSDKIAGKDLAKMYKQHGLKTEYQEMVGDVARFMRDEVKFKKQSPERYNAVKDYIELQSKYEAIRGKEQEIRFTKETKKINATWARGGSWQVSSSKFKNNKELLKEWETLSFELADIINLPPGSTKGNLKMMIDLFTGHYGVLRGVEKWDLVDSPWKVGLRERLTNGKESPLSKSLQKRLREFPWDKLKGSYASQFLTGYKDVLATDGLKTQKEKTRKFMNSENGKLQVELYDLWNSVLQEWVNLSPRDVKSKKDINSDYNRKMNFIARMKKHNSSIGTTGERVLAPAGYYYLPGKVDVGTIKFEHLKSSSEQSYESLLMISEGAWKTKGKKSLEKYKGIWGLLRDFNTIDKATGATNSSNIHRLAESLELAKSIWSVESNLKRSLYQDIVKEVGQKTVDQIMKTDKQLTKKNREMLQDLGLLASKDLSGKIARQHISVVDKALAEGRTIKKKNRGMSTFDFDETVGISENFIVATKGKQKRKIASAEWPFVGDKLLSEGWKMDFTDFNKVTKGKPGPLMQKMKNQIKKFGPDNVYILTARAPESASAIHAWLKSQGVEIPLENITGLGNSTGEAKAMWMLKKFSEGYNDMYFVDDALPNVKAVKNVLEQLDIKSNVQQARILAGKNFDSKINEMMEYSLNIGADKVFSKAEAKFRGKDKKRRKFFMTDSASDLELLIEPLYGKGKKGIENQKWFKDNYLKTWERGINDLNTARQSIVTDYMSLRKENKGVVKKLDKVIEGTSFTNDAAMRVYIWNKKGLEVPGLAEKSRKKLIKHIESNPELLVFAERAAEITKLETGFKPPKETWWAESIASEISEIGQGVSRQKYLKDWMEMSKEIFSEKNLNKMEAELGSLWRESMEDMLYRMESGTTRKKDLGRIGNNIMDYLNGSTGAIMSLNTRSATLQLISTVNFINHAENNPFAAARAFANQKQYWKDFMYIMNSDMLKQRRDGLQINVSEAELAAAVHNKNNKARRAIAYILKQGYIPTKIADSFAIASGGATYYRNRIKMYQKQGLDLKQAEAKAWVDFQAVAERTQQSARPDLLSKQQVSFEGRLVLPFSNTPMQMNRIMMKEVLDLSKGRYEGFYGENSFTNKMSKVAYYGGIQSAIFAGLQTGLFALLAFAEDTDDNTETIANKKLQAMNTMSDSFLRGMGVPGTVVSGLKNGILKFYEQDKKDWTADYSEVGEALLNISPTVGSKFSLMDAGGNTYKYNKKEIKTRGLSIENTKAAEAASQYTQAITNVPVNRVFKKIENIQGALDQRNEAWQRVMLMMGWSKWDLGAANAKNKKPKKTKKIFTGI